MRPMRPRTRNEEGIFEPNMTPLIDVSLVLVVILMVATPLAFQSGIAVSAPPRAAGAAANVARRRADRDHDGLCRRTRDREPDRGAAAALAATLSPLLDRERDTKVVVVRCEDDVDPRRLRRRARRVEAPAARPQIAVMGG